MASHVPEGCFLHQLSVLRVVGDRRVWYEGNGRNRRYYTWDAMHDEVEVFNQRGRHMGALDPFSRSFLKPPVEGRKIEL